VCEGGDVGRCSIWRDQIAECYIQNAVHRVRSRSGYSNGFLYYWLSLLKGAGYIDLVCNKATIAHLTVEKLRALPLFCPPQGEQQAIAAFLDRETAKIDALIAKKERLIKVLEEKQKATINQAMSQGLDTDTPRKDSGMAWIGAIPAHWEIGKLKFYLQSIEQGWSPLCENRQADSNEWGVLKAGCVNAAEFDATEQKALPAEMAPQPKYEIRTGDVLMSRANTRELLGSAAIVKCVRPRLLLCDKLYRLLARPTLLDPRYLVTVLRTHMMRYQMEREATGTSGSMQNIGQDTVQNLILPLPPLVEQRAMIDWFDAQTQMIGTLTVRLRTHIDTLHEHRTALISAAVTGKIDVREDLS